MKVLMFGWEFPPFKSGGLGTACYDLTKGLSRNGVDVTFVMPSTPSNAEADFVKLRGTSELARNVKVRKVVSTLSPYMTSESYIEQSFGQASNSSDVYGKNLFEEVYRYTAVSSKIASDEEHDVIHAHDWMTYEAGKMARATSGKPFVAHIHATEYDRTGGNPNPLIRDVEQDGLTCADIVIANSEFTKRNVLKHYNIPSEKIKVVHWGIDEDNHHYDIGQSSPFKEDKVVLFLGRITIQKGPEYFVKAASLTLDHVPNARFVVAGSGDMLGRMIDLASELGILDRFTFTGFLKGADVHRAFQMADLYVMPSVSEPFGLVALESLKNGTPVLLSKQSGVSEVVSNALKVDFWDVKGMAEKIVFALKYPELYADLKENSDVEVKKFNLDTPAIKMRNIYSEALRGGFSW